MNAGSNGWMRSWIPGSKSCASWSPRSAPISPNFLPDWSARGKSNWRSRMIRFFNFVYFLFIFSSTMLMDMASKSWWNSAMALFWGSWTHWPSRAGNAVWRYGFLILKINYLIKFYLIWFYISVFYKFFYIFINMDFWF